MVQNSLRKFRNYLHLDIDVLYIQLLVGNENDVTTKGGSLHLTYCTLFLSSLDLYIDQQMAKLKVVQVEWFRRVEVIVTWTVTTVKHYKQWKKVENVKNAVEMKEAEKELQVSIVYDSLRLYGNFHLFDS